MKIIKFKKTAKSKYKVYLDNGEVISLYEDVIIDNNLLLTKELDDLLLKKVNEQNNCVHVYTLALNYISIRMRSIKEVKMYLQKKEINSNLIEETVEKLVKNGYLNDFNFAKAYVNDQLIISTKGPLKIKKELLNYGINNDIVDEVIDEIDIIYLKEKLSNLMEKQVRIKKDSANSLKIKLINYFTNLGYSRNMILEELSNYKLKSDYNKLVKDYNKLYNKYKNKYDENDLKYFISQKLYSKGYTGEDISEVINGA